MAHGLHRARKRLGQHFLTDPAVVAAIVAAIDPKPGQHVLEIGPGLGALTQPLVARLGRLTVIELDRDLAARLRQRNDLSVIESDVLRVDLAQLAAAQSVPAWRVVGNLPYNISTPILFHLLRFTDRIEDQHLMLQKEVVDRMVAAPCTADYGRLSVVLQWRYAMVMLHQVPPASFRPPPRVNSAVVRMQAHRNPPWVDPQLLRQLVQVAFSQRRKLMRHTLGRWLEEKAYSGAFDVQRRAEEVPVDEYIALAQAVLQSQPTKPDSPPTAGESARAEFF
jgi:16S rRNA (adenine1518-N6/adenine1519-N6)-dimethyltransferase